MRHSSSIIRSLSISLLLSSTFALFAQESVQKRSDSIAPKERKYGKVRLQTSIRSGSSDMIKASLICGKDTLREDYRSSNYIFWNKVPVGIARAIVWADGFISDSDTLYINEGQTTKKGFYLTDRVIQLQAVTVKGTIPAMVYRGDTILFNPKGINVLEDDVARNILEQMPGVKVSEQGVEVAGKQIVKTYIDGKKIFGENPMTALNHLPATDVLHIYAYDEDENKEQDRKNRRGKRRRVLNIETKSKLVNSKEGNIITSVGGNLDKQNLTDHNIRYGVGGTFNFFSEQMLLSVNAMHNNLNRSTNQPQIFLSTKNPPQAYSENNYGGFNLSRRWEKEKGFYKEVKGGYQFSQIATETNTRLRQEYFATDAFQQRTYISQNHGTNQDNKHHVNVGFDMNDKKWGTLGINYALSAENARQNTWQQIENRVDENQSIGTLLQANRRKTLETQGKVNWAKFFNDWKYTIEANYTNSSSDEKENRENNTKDEATGSLQNIIDIPSNSKGHKWQVNTGLRRNLSQESNDHIAFEYKLEPNNSHINQLAQNKITEEIDQANTYSYRNQLTEHTAQMALWLTDIHIISMNFTSGWKHSIIKDRKETIQTTNTKTFNAFIGEFYLGLGGKISEKSTHELKYTINSQLPNIVQLRPEIKNSNPYFLSSGNSNLKASTQHKIWWKEQYRFNDYGHMINSEVTLFFIQNSISNRTIYFNENTYLSDWDYNAIANSSLSSYDNLNGAWKAHWDLSWSYPIGKIKSNLTVNVATSYEHTPYYYNLVRDVARIRSTRASISFHPR